MALAGSLAQKNSSRQRRHLPRVRRHVHHPAARHGAAGRRAELPARADARPDCRTLPHAPRKTVLITNPFYDAQSSITFDWKIAGPAGHRRRLQKARPAPDGQKPRHVRDDGRRGADHRRDFHRPADRGFIAQIAIWLWFTVLFANFAEAVAEGRGKAQAKALRGTRVKRTPAASAKMARWKKSAPTTCAKAMSSSCAPAKSFPPTATSSKARPPWTNRPSPANPRPSSAKAAATAAPSPAARACSRTKSKSASPPIPAKVFSTA
jgi:hypothetical protein